MSTGAELILSSYLDLATACSIFLGGSGWQGGRQPDGRKDFGQLDRRRDIDLPQLPVCQNGETQAVTVQERMVQARPGRPAVTPVADDWPAGVGQLPSGLVLTSGHQVKVEEAKRP